MYRQTARSAKVRAASRAKLMAAARRLFARHGYAATTMRDIARAARSSIGNLYFYFENKDELIRSLMLETRGPVWAWADAAAAAAPRGAARVAIVTYATVIRLLTVDRDLMRLVAMEGAPPELERGSVEEHLTRLRANLRENFPDYPAAEVEPALAAWSGAVRRCLERAVQGDLDAEPAALAAFVVRWNLRGLGLSDAEISAALELAERAFREGTFPGQA
jgi:AcrR family transcriptional regulator